MNIRESSNKHLWFVVDDKDKIVKVFMNKSNACLYIEGRKDVNNKTS